MIEREARTRRPRADVAWSLYLAALSGAGVVALALVPGAMLRVHTGLSLMLLLTFALGGVVADAVWKARPWRWVAVYVSTATAGLFTMIKYAEVLWTPAGEPMFAPAPRIIRLLLVLSLFALSLRREHGTRQSRPRPVSPS